MLENLQHDLSNCLLIFFNPQWVDMKYNAHDPIAKAHALVRWNNSQMHFALQPHSLRGVTHEQVSIGPYQWSYQ